MTGPDIQITSTNMDVTDSMKALATEKLQKVLTKLVHVKDDLKSFRIVLNTAPMGMFCTKIDSVIHGREFFAESTDYNLETSLVKTVDELGKQVEKWKADDEKSWRDKRKTKSFLDSGIEKE